MTDAEYDALLTEQGKGWRKTLGLEPSETMYLVQNDKRHKVTKDNLFRKTRELAAKGHVHLLVMYGDDVAVIGTQPNPAVDG